jgi:Leucine-rich repeat (LRR) protein
LPDNFLINSAFTGETVSIYLQNNEITGTIPAELSKFDFLDINLAGNKIYEVPDELCNIDGWMQGNSKLIGNCSAILCPQGRFNMFGHQSPGNPCLPCSHLEDVGFLGQTRCENFTSERDTLNEIFMATGGEFWVSNKSWQSEDPICTWTGVLCEDGDLQDTHGITSINLDVNDLSGTLPSDIWTLPSLRSFSVKGNPNLVVPFEGLANAADTLEVLYLSGVQMPSLGGISAATSLKELHITGNELKGTMCFDWSR